MPGTKQGSQPVLVFWLCKPPRVARDLFSGEEFKRIDQKGNRTCAGEWNGMESLRTGETMYIYGGRASFGKGKKQP